MTDDKFGKDEHLQNFDSKIEDERTISVVKEEVVIDKQKVVTNEVNLKKTVKTEVVDIPLTNTYTRYEEERIPIDRLIDEMPRTREEDGKLIIPVVREEAVVVKRLRLVEEIHLTRQTEVENRTEQVTLRSDEVTLDRRPGQ